MNEQFKKSTFTCTRGADDKNEFTLFDIKADIFQGFSSVGINL